LNPKKDAFDFTKLKNDLEEDYAEDKAANKIGSRRERAAIEKELFQEFEKNKVNDEPVNEDNDDTPETKEISEDVISFAKEEPLEEEKKNDNDFLKGSLDDYIKTFDEKKVKDIDLDSILGDDFFPNIP